MQSQQQAEAMEYRPLRKENEMRYRGIHHLAMATRDMDATIRFWRDLLGMRLVAGLGKPGYRHYFFQVSDTDFIAFFQWPAVEPVPEKDHGYPVAGPFVFDHVCLGVETRDELWCIKDRLEAAGFWVSEAVDHGFIQSVYSFDPNGIPIEFAVELDSVDLRRRPCMVDFQPSGTTLEGCEPQPHKWPDVEHPTPPGERIAYPGEGLDLVSGEKKDWWRRE